MTVRRAVARLGISKDAVRRLIYAGELKAHQKTDGGMWIIDDPSVAAYEKRRDAAQPAIKSRNEWMERAKLLRQAANACRRLAEAELAKSRRG